MILTFNKKATREIASRIRGVFGIENFENARTFHSLAYQLVPDKGEILFDDQGDFSRPALTNFVQEILRSIWSPEIQTRIYSLFRKEMASLERSGGLLNDADYIAYIRNRRDITLNGDRAKSAGEKYIADYLFEHDISYFYERVEFWNHHNYRPDFTLFTETGQVVIEFWGIDEDDPHHSISSAWGLSWDQYHTEMLEKRRYWKGKGIPLIELSIVDLRRGRAKFEQNLENRLADIGISKDKLPQKELERKVIQFQKDRMSGLFVQFIEKAKKRMWSVQVTREQVRKYKTTDERVKLFLTLGCQVYEAYQKGLASRNAMDFNDLLTKAAERIQETGANCTIDLGHRKERHVKIKDIEWILVDEYQDFSHEFYCLIDSIQKQNPNVNLVFVGDDWQAINSFAGSDLRFFNEYQTYFQDGRINHLLTNHRSQKAIVDNGNNLMLGRGEPSRALPDHNGGSVVRQEIDDIRINSRKDEATQTDEAEDERYIFREVRAAGLKINDNGFLQAKYLKACHKILLEPENWNLLRRSNKKKPVVAILSRTNMLYRITVDEFLHKLKGCFSDEELKIIGDFHQKVKISTVHSFKGLEAEIVIILRACDGSFPLLHPDNSLFEFFGQTEQHVLDEERRLFYVAITRPSQRLYILTEKGMGSSFIE